MRFGRFIYGDRLGFGSFGETDIQPISWDPFMELTEGEEYIPIADVRLMAPVVPSKIVAVGLNYQDHAEELGMDIPDVPILFVKVTDTLLEPNGTVAFPKQSKKVDYEGELAVVIGQITKDVSVERAPASVLGYTCALDMTARDLQVADGQWTRAKNFDTFCPLGPWVETDADPADLAIEVTLNGEVKQSSRTSHMIFDVPFLVSFISQVMTLNPGDVILTGTPPGVGEVRPGDHLAVTIEGIGTLECDIGAPGA